MTQNPTTGIKIAVMLVLVFMLYLSAATFFDIPQSGNEHAKTIIPFLLGVIATLIGFYWGNSHKEQQQQAPTETRIESETKTVKTESTTDKPEEKE